VVPRLLAASIYTALTVVLYGSSDRFGSPEFLGATFVAVLLMISLTAGAVIGRPWALALPIVVFAGFALSVGPEGVGDTSAFGVWLILVIPSAVAVCGLGAGLLIRRATRRGGPNRAEPT